MSSGVSESLAGQMASLHAGMRSRLAGVARLAVALYDPKTDLLKTFVHSTDGPTPLVRYETTLAEVPSLSRLAATRTERVIDDLSKLAGSDHLHTAKVLEGGYRSSFTAPLCEGERLTGFVFFDSMRKGYFSAARVEDLRMFARLVSLVVQETLVPARIVRSAVQVAARLTHFRDPETGEHLDRMSRYARLIALSLAEDAGLSDETIEFLFLFAPLHDIGKVAIPDAILLKRASLSDEEFEVMKTHATRGGEIVDQVIDDLQLPNFPHATLLRNLVRFHHEASDGGGYPEGLSGGRIPLEARIVAVADVLDALMSERPYKRPWTLDESLEFLVSGAGTRFDPACVGALTSQKDAVEAIRRRFADRAGSPTESREGYTPDL